MLKTNWTDRMDALDRRLIDLVQQEIPLVPRPFAEFANRLGIQEQECLSRLRAQMDAGVFRRIGASFDVRRFGGTSVLAALAVASEHIPVAVRRINRYAEVTHNYQRDCPALPLWFTVTSLHPQRVRAILDEIAAMPEARGLAELPALRVFKTRVFFPLAETAPQNPGSPTPGDPTSPPPPLPPPGPHNLALIGALQEDFPVTAQPFAEIAMRAGLPDERSVLRRLRRWRAAGALRRICGFVQRRRFGYRANALLAWEMDEDEINRVGHRIAASPVVSHCYERRPHPLFACRLYAMAHARNASDLDAEIHRLTSTLGLDRPRVLRTVREWKRSSPRLVDGLSRPQSS